MISEEIEERTRSMEFTEELMEMYEIDHSLIEEKAEVLENTINGVVFLTDANRRGVRVDVIRAKDAEPDIIRRQLEDMHTEVIACSEVGDGGRWEMKQ